MVSDAQCLDKIESNELDISVDQCVFYNERQILSIIFAAFITIIYIPPMIYGVYNIYKFRNTIIMQKRHYGLSMAIAVLHLLQILSVIVFIMFYGGYMRFSPISRGTFILIAMLEVVGWLY